MTRPLQACFLTILMITGSAEVRAQAALPVVASEDQGGSACGSNMSASSESSARCRAKEQQGSIADSGSRWLLSIGSIGGHDNAFAGRVSLPANFAGGQIYTGAVFQRDASYSMIENTATAINYQMNGGTLQYLDSTALSTSKSVSPKTLWTFDLDNSFGNDAIRLIAPLRTENLETATYGIHSGKVLDNQATVRISRQSTQTRWWSLSARNNYRNFFDDKSYVNTVHVKAEIQYQPSARAGIGLYDETSLLRGMMDCSMNSLGAVYERRISRTISGEIAAGPAFGTKGCVVRITGNMYGALALQPWRSTNIYLSVFRKLNDSAFVASTYENAVHFRMNQRLGAAAWLKLQSGYVSGTVPSNVKPFHGVYGAGTIEKMLPGGFSIAASAQHFDWSGVANTAPSRTFLIGTLSWSPNKNISQEMHGPVAR